MSCFDENEIRRFNLHGIRFKTWLYFFFMTVAIIAVLLVMQVSFFAVYYRNTKSDELKRIGDGLIEEYSRQPSKKEFSEFVYQTSFAYGMTASFFQIDYTVDGNTVTVDNDTFVNLLTSANFVGDQTGEASAEGVISIGAEYFRRLDGGEPFVYISSVSKNKSFAVYGAKLKDPVVGDVCMYLSTPLTLSKFMITTMRGQAYLSCLLCLVLSLVLSWFISERIARPVKDFSFTARKLAKGDYSVKFEGNGLSEIEDLADTLNYATEEMGKTEQLRRDLLANVSHDLRTPLTMVKAYAEMIRDISGGDEKKRLSHSQTIIDEADRLTNLVNDIQNLSKLQAGTETVEMRDVDLGSLTNTVLERFDIYSSKENYVFRKEIDADCPIIIGDEAKIEQVLYNLIGNAINYTGEDKTVTVYVKSRDNKVFFGVRDTGKGIAPEEIDSVWERYYRASQSKRKSVGTGLGLSIVKNILQLHGAEYGIRSTVGEGSLFWFSMPVKQESPAPAEELPERKRRRRRK